MHCHFIPPISSSGEGVKLRWKDVGWGELVLASASLFHLSSFGSCASEPVRYKCGLIDNEESEVCPFQQFLTIQESHPDHVII